MNISVKQVQQKTDHYNLNEGRTYCRLVLLNCISVSQVDLINWQLKSIEKLLMDKKTPDWNVSVLNM